MEKKSIFLKQTKASKKVIINNNVISKKYEREVEKELLKYKSLRDLDAFVLDNSIRESTVGQLKGHTLESKWEIYNEVKKCGFNNIIVASFSSMKGVDDIFIKELVDTGEDRHGLFAFSEITAGVKNGIPDETTIPIGIRKLKEAGMWNVIFEVDLGDTAFNFKKYSVRQLCELIKKWVVWSHKHLHKGAKIFLNFRDIPDVVARHSDRVFQVIDFLGHLPREYRLYGILFEEPKGTSTPEECGLMAKYIRQKMDDNNWNGHLLVHVHEKFGFSEISQLQALMNGANGIWASICVEGAAMGHASACVTLMNLIRLGNTKVLNRYNCTYLRKAAINVTRITTGEDPPPKQPVYGTRALDMVFDLGKEEFDLAEFFGEKAPVRITTLASPEMIREQLIVLFGEDDDFTIERAVLMKEVMLQDLKENRKEEYMSKVGIAMLYDRSGGSLTVAMRDVIAEDDIASPHAQQLIAEIRKKWDMWDLQDEVQGDDMLQYDSFYSGFMAPYFSCYRCEDTKKALQALDMDADGYVDWSEILVYLKWAIHEYPNCKDANELMDVAFRKGLIPAMRDELVKEN